MKVEDIKNLIVPTQFGINNEGDECSVAMEEVMEQLPQSVAEGCAWGVSKFVIFPDEDKDVVVKLPFSGTFCEVWQDDTEEYESYFDYYNSKHDNYCEMEANIYEEAEEEGVEEFFASTKYAGRTASDTPYYVSERVYGYISDELIRVTPSEDSVKKAESKYASMRTSWLAEAIEWYGEAKVDKFLKFVETHNINDLHNGNFGYRKNGAPCLLDYSGFQWD